MASGLSSRHRRRSPMGPESRHTPAARYFSAVAQDGRIAKIDIIKAFRQFLHGSVSGTEMWSKDVRNTPARNTGLDLPFHHADQNRIRLAISALAADLGRCARVALHPNGAITSRTAAASNPPSPGASSGPRDACVLHIDSPGPGPRPSPPATPGSAPFPPPGADPAPTNPDREPGRMQGWEPLPPGEDHSTTVTKDQDNQPVALLASLVQVSCVRP